MKITMGGLGLAVVIDEGNISGVITDGDLRRALFNYERLEGLTAASVMTRSPLTICETEMFADAETIMLKANITGLLVVDRGGALSGVIKLQNASLVA